MTQPLRRLLLLHLHPQHHRQKKEKDHESHDQQAAMFDG
jgi:hypothetical protein